VSLPTLPTFQFNGRAALVRVIEQSEYRSLEQVYLSGRQQVLFSLVA